MKKIFVERDYDDDVLDALSLWINKKLKTEKKRKDKKDNVYFWLFKFILLLCYIFIIKALFDGISEFGVSLIYYFAISLRSVLSLIYIFIVEFAKDLIILYTLYKNLNIFTSSNYYKKLYAKDKKMLKGKEKVFNVAKYIIKALSFVLLVELGLIASITLILSSLLVTLFIKSGAYSIGISLLFVTIFLICFFLFKEIYNKFIGKSKKTNKKLFACLFLSVIVSVIVFGYETNSYKYTAKLPLGFKTEDKELYFDIQDKKEIIFKSNSKYDNVKIYEDSTLDGKMKVVLTQFETAKTYYTSYLNDDNRLNLVFDSYFDPNVETLTDILKIGVNTIKNKTIYNYNMLKYPEITIYVNSKDKNKIEIKKGNVNANWNNR